MLAGLDNLLIFTLSHTETWLGECRRMMHSSRYTCMYVSIYVCEKRKGEREENDAFVRLQAL